MHELADKTEADEGVCLSVTITWRDRWGGGSSTFSATNIKLSDARAAARRMGWPGHGGSFWDYLKDDIRRLVASLAAPTEKN